MSKLAGILGVMILFSVLSVQAQEVDVIYGLVTVENSDVRAGPDFAYPIIGQLPLNTSVVVTGRSGDFYHSWDGRQWLQIDYGDRRAWIYARLVRTSVAFNSIFPTGRPLPRDANGRVPDEFDTTNGDICASWQGDFVLSGNFMAGDTELTATYPALQGTTVYSVIVISPSQFRTPFDSETTTATIRLDKLPYEGGVYTWRVAPYWTTSTYRYNWQQVCLLRTGGTFEKPDTTPKREEQEE